MIISVNNLNPHPSKCVLRKSYTEAITLVGQTTDGCEIQDLSRDLQPDVLLLAFNIAHPPWTNILSYLTKHCPAVKVLALFACTDKVYPYGLMQSVAGAILKSEPPEKLVEAVCTIATGKPWFSPTVLQRLIQQEAVQNVSNILGEQALEILRLVVEQKTDKEIAQILNMSERNVRRHLRHIYDELEVNSRVGAAFKAGQLGLFK